MLEILGLFWLTKRIGLIVEQKGHRSLWYKVMTVLLWFGGEFAGAFMGALLTQGDESALCVLYLIAIMGAVAGAGISYLIATSLGVIGPSLVAGAAGAPQAGVRERIPLPLLWIVWLLTNILALLGATITANLINPNYETDLSAIATISAGIVAGVTAGMLQWLILFLILPNIRRAILTLWIPATIFGWAFGYFLYVVLPYSPGMDLVISVFSGLAIGLLQWLILRSFGQRSYWWIPVNVLDWVFNWVINLSTIFWGIHFIVGTFLTAAIGFIASSIAIVFILQKALVISEAGPGNLSSIGKN